MASKDLKKLQKAAEELGFEFVRITGKSHYLYKHKVTKHTVTLPGTPSDHRSFLNALALLRNRAK